MGGRRVNRNFEDPAPIPREIYVTPKPVAGMTVGRRRKKKIADAAGQMTDEEKAIVDNAQENAKLVEQADEIIERRSRQFRRAFNRIDYSEDD